MKAFREAQEIPLLTGWIEAHCYSAAGEDSAGVFVMDAQGAHILVSNEAVRAIVNFLDVCEEVLGLETCYILVPKHVPQSKKLMKLLSQCFDLAFVDAKSVSALNTYDVLDWYTCVCEL